MRNASGWVITAAVCLVTFPPNHYTGPSLRRTQSGGVVLEAQQQREGIACVLVGDLGPMQPTQVEVSLDACMAVQLSQGSLASSSTPIIKADWGTHTVTAQPLEVLKDCPVHAPKLGAQRVGPPCAVRLRV